MLDWIFNSGFAARGTCTGWYPALNWVYIISDLAIWLAYMAIPGILIWFTRKKKGLPFPIAFYWFAAFIIGCGLTHATDAMVFIWPVFNLVVIFHIFTAVVSWGTIFYLIPIIPKAINLKSPNELEDSNKKLEMERNRYIAVSNTLKEAIITCNVHGTVIDCNNATEQVFGWKREELVGKSILVLAPKKDVAKYQQAIIAFSKIGEPTLFGSKVTDVEFLHKDGHLIWIAISTVPVRYDSELLFTALCRDITERIENEKKIHLLNETLKTRVEALESFQFSIAHDLNAPLRTMEGFSEILAEDYAEKIDKQGLDCIHRIQAAVRRMRQLVVDMVRLSRVTSADVQLRIEVVNLSDMAKEILEEHVANFNDNNRMYKFTIQPDLILEAADREFIQIALMNLLSNAWKFTAKKDVTEIEFGVTKQNGKNVYYVKDNGAGFDMAKADKLFKPFSRLHDKKEFDGNGIGLSIVKQVITLHEGEVWAISELGKGATFYFTIGTKHNARQT